MVSKSDKERIAVEKLKDVAMQMSKEQGNTPEYWYNVILHSKLYSKIFDFRNGLWGEGTIYLTDCLIEELGGFKQ